MSTDQRKYIRFSLEVPALVHTKFGQRHETVLQQISVGGCFTKWEESIYPGDEFRMEIVLPNKNRLPLSCKAIYRFENTGIGVKFVDIAKFEQELLSKIISHTLEAEGLSPIDPMHILDTAADSNEPQITDERKVKESRLDEVMSGEEVV